MGGNNSKPPTKRVKAPKELKTNDLFNVEAMGATWKNLQVPNDTDTVKKGEDFDAIFDPEKVIINIKAQQDAQEGFKFKAGTAPWGWIVEKAPEGGVKANCFYDIKFDNISFAKMVVFESNETSMKIPDKKFTGVDKHITQICANMAQQIYIATRMKDFNTETADGKHEAKLVILDNHRAYNHSIPTFAVGIVDQTMILAWRGTNTNGSKTNTVFDVISDFAIGPTMCHLLDKASSGIRMQNAMHSFASLELEVHGDKIVSLINDKNIKEIVFTGHSLGGGIAQCAHPILQAQLDGLNESSSAKKWKELKNAKTLKLRTLVFSAVQSVLGKGLALDPNGNNIVNKESDDLLDKIGKNTVNLVYGKDIVPRGYSHTKYIKEIVDKLVEESREIAGDKVNWTLGAFPTNYEEMTRSIVSMFEKDIAGVLKDFRHQGKILYYKDEAATKGNPEILTNTEFDSITYESLGETETGGKRIDNIANDHGNPKDLLASYIAVKISDLEEAQKKNDSYSEGPEPAKKKQKRHS